MKIITSRTTIKRGFLVKKHLRQLGTVLAALGVAHGASAQVSAPATGLEEVVVTAQHRQENLQDVPLAVSAISADQFRESGMHDLSGIAQQIPGLTFSPYAPGQNIIAMRGVSSNDDGAGTDNSVAVFVDGVYQGRVSNVNPDMFDVSSVQVLRGPQGTLYGKNTIGGAIVITTPAPDLNKVTGWGQADFGDYNLRQFQGSISGPIADGWALRLSGERRTRDGFIHEAVLGTTEANDNTQNYRTQLLYDKGGATLLLSADYQQTHVDDMGRVPLTQVKGNLGPIVNEYEQYCGSLNPYCATNRVPGYALKKAYGGSAQIDFDTGLGKVTSISAYRVNLDYWLMDSVGAPNFPPLGNFVDDATRQWTQEVRLAGTAGDFKYVGGVFYDHEATDRTRIFDVNLQGDYSNVPASGQPQYTQDNVTNSAAAFGQVDWAFASDWVVSLGGRYTYDAKRIENNSFAGANVVIPIIAQTFSNTRSASWGQFTPKATMSYSPTSNSTAYVTVAEGFKSGGFAAAPINIQATNPLLPEKALDFEAGYKSQFFNNTLRFNIAAFRTLYQDLQFQSFGPRPGVKEFGEFQTSNLHSAFADGIEPEIQWLPIPGLTLSGSYGYLYARYKNAYISNGDFPNQNNQQMMRSPRHKGSASARYDWDLGDNVGILSNAIDYSYTDHQRGEIEPWAIQPAYFLLNDRLSWTLPDGHTELALWGRNLTNESYIAHLYTVGGEALGVFGQPRTYGGTVRYSF